MPLDMTQRKWSYRVSRTASLRFLRSIAATSITSAALTAGALKKYDRLRNSPLPRSDSKCPVLFTRPSDGRIEEDDSELMFYSVCRISQLLQPDRSNQYEHKLANLHFL